MKIVCLANSFRVGGRCLGGIQLDANNRPVLENNRPKWIRPVCQTGHEEVPVELVADIHLLDIIEFQERGACGHGHQTENVLFDEASLRKIGVFQKGGLTDITDNSRYNLVFGNRGKAVPEHLVENYSYSLMMVLVDNFEVIERSYENRYYPQKRLSFKYNNNTYDLPITDPIFLHRYEHNNSILDDVENVFLSLSLASPNEEWCSKLVAGLIF